MKQNKLKFAGLIIIIMSVVVYYFSAKKQKERKEILENAVVVTDYQKLKGVSPEDTLIIEGTISKKTQPIVKEFALACSERLKIRKSSKTKRKRKRKKGKRKRKRTKIKDRGSWKRSSSFVQSFLLVVGSKEVRVQATSKMKNMCPKGEYHTKYQGKNKRYKGVMAGETISILGRKETSGDKLIISGESYYGGTAEAMKKSMSRGRYIKFAGIGGVILGLILLIIGIIKKK